MPLIVSAHHSSGREPADRDSRRPKISFVPHPARGDETDSGPLLFRAGRRYGRRHRHRRLEIDGSDTIALLKAGRQGQVLSEQTQYSGGKSKNLANKREKRQPAVILMVGLIFSEV
jgi:hypothetical protein